jgi:hypothetical protein
MQSYEITESAKIAKLWQGFHHLSENNKDLLLAVAEAVMYSTRNVPAKPEHTENIKCIPHGIKFPCGNF